MRLGFLTACMPDRDLTEIVAWAAEHRFEALEVAAWPDLGDRPFTATNIKVEQLGQGEADEIRELFAANGLELSSLAFYDNNLHPDPAERKASTTTCGLRRRRPAGGPDGRDLRRP